MKKVNLSALSDNFSGTTKILACVTVGAGIATAVAYAKDSTETNAEVEEIVSEVTETVGDIISDVTE